MPVDSKAPEIIEAESRVRKARVVISGEEAVHEAGTAYLPKLDDMTDAQYNSYKGRTLFFNATGRTVDGLVGQIFRKDMSINRDSKAEQFAEDVTRSGVPYESYVMSVVTEVLSVGICGTFVDYSAAPRGATVAMAEKEGYGASWTMYYFENIRNYKYEKINGRIQLSLVTLNESVVDEFKSDMFKTEYVAAIRVLRLENGVYVNELYVQRSAGYTLEESTTPIMNGKAMNFIPFMIHFPDLNKREIEPPLIDLINVNVKHYQLKADQAHALHYVALPTPYMTGVDPEDEHAPKSIGPNKLWIIANSEAEVGMLEYTGAGIESIDKELTRMEQQMAQLGARMLSPAKDFAETATAEQIKSIGEHSMLYKIVNSIDNQMDRVNEWTSLWIGSSKMESELNKDFVSSRMSSQDIIAMVSSWQKGAISKRTMFENFKKGEIIDPEADFDEEEAEIQAELDRVADDDDDDDDDLNDE